MKPSLFHLLVALPFLQAKADIVLAVSPDVRRTETAKQIYLGVESNLLPRLEPNEKLTVIDGLSLEVKARFVIPDDPSLKTQPKLKAALMKSQLRELKTWLGGQAEGDTSRLDAPGVFAKCASDGDFGRGQSEIILVGNMIYDSAANPGFSMRDDLVPSDGHIGSPLRETPFGLQGATNRLQGISVHWNELGLVGKDGGYIADVQRFWSVWTKAQGAFLCQIDRDTADFFHGITEQHQPPYQNAQADTNAPVVMLKRGPRAIEVVGDKVLPKKAEPSVVAFLVDTSQSMFSLRHKVADAIANHPIADNTLYLLFTFSDYDRDDQDVPVALLLGESRDPKTLAPLFRGTRFLGGRTDDEAHNEGLDVVSKTLAARGLKASAIMIYSDNRPHELKEQPSNRPNFREQVNALSSEHTAVTFFWLNREAPKWQPPSTIQMRLLP